MHIADWSAAHNASRYSAQISTPVQQHAHKEKYLLLTDFVSRSAAKVVSRGPEIM